jgi:hypothetical protein
MYRVIRKTKNGGIDYGFPHDKENAEKTRDVLAKIHCHAIIVPETHYLEALDTLTRGGIYQGVCGNTLEGVKV